MYKRRQRDDPSSTHTSENQDDTQEGVRRFSHNNSLLECVLLKLEISDH